MLTRKHFNTIANTLADNRKEWERVDGLDTSGAVLDSVARDMADAMRQFNPSFDRDRFLKACGVED